MRHHHTTIVELHSDHTKIMFLQPTQSNNTYQSHVNLDNQSSHSCYMPKSCHTHQCQSIHHLIHPKSLIPCFNIINLTKHVANIQERRSKNLAHSHPVFTQASSFRLGESSKRGTMVLSRSLA